MENVGGILGLNLDACETNDCSSMWQSGQYKVERLTIALGFENEYDWWYKAEHTELPATADANSIFAVNDKDLRKDRARGDTFSKTTVLLGDSNLFEWKAESILFNNKSIELDQIFEISMGLPGIGLPETIYMEVAKTLYATESSIICPSDMGNSCHSKNVCSSLLKTLEGMHFKF